MTDLNSCIKIHNHLQILGAMHWYMPLMEWLAQYDGLSLILGTEALSPEAELLHALNSLKPGDDLELGKLIASLDFLHWRIRLTIANDGTRFTNLLQII